MQLDTYSLIEKREADIIFPFYSSCGVDERTSVIFQAAEEVSKSLVAMKEILYGTNEKEPQTEAVAQLAQELYNSSLLSTLIADLQLIDFEVTLFIFNRWLERKMYLIENDRTGNKTGKKINFLGS